DATAGITGTGNTPGMANYNDRVLEALAAEDPATLQALSATWHKAKELEAERDTVQAAVPVEVPEEEWDSNEVRQWLLTADADAVHDRLSNVATTAARDTLARQITTFATMDGNRHDVIEA